MFGETQQNRNPDAHSSFGVATSVALKTYNPGGASCGMHLQIGSLLAAWSANRMQYPPPCLPTPGQACPRGLLSARRRDVCNTSIFPLPLA